jgi:hypothetical protein
VRQQVTQFVLERLGRDDALARAIQLVEGRHQRLGDEPTPEGAKISGGACGAGGGRLHKAVY